MAKDPKSKRTPQRKGEEFAGLYKNDVEFGEEDFVEDAEVVLDDDAIIEDWEEEDEAGRPAKKAPEPAEKADREPSTMGRLRERLKPRAVRPGEQDVLQSPVVLGLFGGTLLLLLIAGILWFIIGRQSSQKAFDAAQAALDEGRYSQAIQLFDSFQAVYPTHKLLPDARIGTGKASILQHITGAAPDWAQGLKALEDFIRDFKDEEEFEEIKPDLRRYAMEIAEGSAKTAAQARDRSLLGIPPKALVIAQRYTPNEAEGQEFGRKIDRLLVIAKDAIVKQETYDAAVQRIEAALAETPPRTLDALHIREGLLNRYPDVSANRKVTALLRQTLDAEKRLVAPAAAEIQVSNEDHAGLPQPPVSLLMHTRTRSDQGSEDRTIFGIAKGCLYGVDTATGEPVWRRSIGLDTPFFPKPIHTETPGVLVFDTNHRELLALAERTGALLWRLPLNDDLAGGPLIHNNVIYLASTGSRLYKIDLQTGAPAGVLQFSQPLLSPPIAAPDGQHLIAVGDRELIYTVALQDFACVAVSHVGHKRGTGQALAASSVDAPLIGMGDLILLAENDRTDGSLLRVFRMSEPEEEIKQVAAHRIEGQVRDAPALRGNQLYVPSTGERLTAFTVSDAPDQPPLTMISTQKLQMPHEGPMHLLALEGQVWMATSALRRLENNSGTLAFVGEPMAVGVVAQPIQQLGDSLYVARHRPYAGSSLLIQFQYESLRTNWGLTMGSSILAANVTGDTLVCVNEDGQVFRMSAADFAPTEGSARFQTTPSVTLNLPQNLDSPLGAVPLEDGSIFAYAGGKEPRAWFITPNAQLGRGLDIPGGLQTKPVAIRDGMVLPLEGRLHYVPARPGGPRVDDYTRQLNVNPPDNQSPPRWMHLERLDDSQFVALDSSGALMRFQFRTDPSPHLFEVRNLQLKSPVNIPFAAVEDVVVFADADRKLHVLDAQSFQILGSAPLDGEATNAVWMADGKAFVETNGSELHAFELTPAPKKLWSLSLENSGLAGRPMKMGAALLITKQNGEVWTVDPGTGKIEQRHAVDQILVDAPLKFGDRILAPSLDGSLYPLESLLTGGQ